MVTAKLALVQFMVLGLRELGDSSTSGTSKVFFMVCNSYDVHVNIKH